MSRRDDFTKKTIDLLARRAGGKCSMCFAPTWGPNDKPFSVTNIGQAAHIAAAAEGGPRYVAKMTPEERTSISNGLWLCSNCHDQIDRNVETYTIPKLKQIKKEAEKKARKALGVASKDSPGAISSGVISEITSGVAVIDIRRVKARLATFHGRNMTKTEADEILSSLEFINLQEDVYMPQVGSELLLVMEKLLVYCKDAKTRLEVIRHLDEIVSKFHTSLELKQVQQLCDVLMNVAKSCGSNTLVYQSTVAFLKNMALLLTKSPFSKVPKSSLDLLPAERKKQRAAVMRGGREDVDNPQAKIPRLDNDNEENDQTDSYLVKMSELAEMEDVASSLDLEEEIMSMGFDPQIL